MNAHQDAAAPTYFLSGGKFLLNEAGDKVCSDYECAVRAKERLDASWAGAFIARLLVNHPWLDSMTIELRASAETGDEGQIYRSVCASVSGVTAVNGVLLPESIDDDGDIDEPSAVTLLENVLQDHDGDLYASFLASDEYDDLDLIVQRDAIAALLNGDRIDGNEAFSRLFPDRMPALASVPSA